MLGYRMTQGAWYLQDEMKLRSNLTVALGLRHEMTDGWNEVGGRCSNYTFDKNLVISTEPRIGKSCFTDKSRQIAVAAARRHRVGPHRHWNLGGAGRLWNSQRSPGQSREPDLFQPAV